MTSFNESFTKRIILFIFLPLLMNLFYIQQLNINMAYFIVLVQIIIFICLVNKIKIKINKSQGLILILFFLLFIIAIFSSLFSKLQIDSFKTTFLVFVTNIFLILLIFSDNNPYKTFVNIAKVNMYIGFISSTIALILFLFGHIMEISGRKVQAIILGPIKLYQIIMGMPPCYRVSSLTTNPNTLGIILMLSQIATLYLFKINLMSKKKFTAFYAIQITALILTRSRGAIITSFIMFVTFFLLTSKTKINKIKKYTIFLILIVFMYYIITNEYFIVFFRLQSGLNNREIAWEIMRKQIHISPFIGLGFGVSGKVLLYDIEIKAHNVFLNSILEIGLFGFVVFVCIWLSGIIYSFLKIEVNKNNHEIINTYALVFSILFSLIFHQIVENKLLVYDFVMFLWVYLISFSTIPLNVKSHREN